MIRRFLCWLTWCETSGEVFVNEYYPDIQTQACKFCKTRYRVNSQNFLRDATRATFSMRRNDAKKN